MNVITTSLSCPLNSLVCIKHASGCIPLLLVLSWKSWISAPRANTNSSSFQPKRLFPWVCHLWTPAIIQGLFRPYHNIVFFRIAFQPGPWPHCLMSDVPLYFGIAIIQQSRIIIPIFMTFKRHATSYFSSLVFSTFGGSLCAVAVSLLVLELANPY